MKKEKKNQDDAEIELVSIEDLRTAMGGVYSSSSSTGIDPSTALKTTMCSGWSNQIPGPEVYF